MIENCKRGHAVVKGQKEFCPWCRVMALEAKMYISRRLLREWLRTELDPMDEEFAPWLESFTERVKKALGDDVPL